MMFTDSINNTDFVGVDFRHGGRSIVLEIAENTYVGESFDGESIKGRWTATSKREYVEEALGQNETKAYVFGSRKEMLEWFMGK